MVVLQNSKYFEWFLQLEYFGKYFLESPSDGAGDAYPLRLRWRLPRLTCWWSGQVRVLSLSLARWNNRLAKSWLLLFPLFWVRARVTFWTGSLSFFVLAPNDGQFPRSHTLTHTHIHAREYTHFYTAEQLVVVAVVVSCEAILVFYLIVCFTSYLLYNWDGREYQFGQRQVFTTARASLWHIHATYDECVCVCVSGVRGVGVCRGERDRELSMGHQVAVACFFCCPDLGPDVFELANQMRTVAKKCTPPPPPPSAVGLPLPSGAFGHILRHLVVGWPLFLAGYASNSSTNSNSTPLNWQPQRGRGHGPG